MRRIHVRWDGCLELGLVAVLAGCGVGAPAGGTGPGTGGHPTTSDAGPTPEAGSTGPGAPSSSATPSCTVAADAALGTDEATSPAVAFGGGHFAAAWTEQDSGVHVALVNASGDVSGARVLAGPGASEPAVTALPSGGFLVVWREPGVVRGERLAADGSPSGAPFQLGTTTGGDPKPAATSVGSGTVVAWADASGVTAGQLEGNALGAHTSIAGASDPGLAPNGDAVALVFSTGAKLGHARLALPMHDAEPSLFRDAPGKANVPRASATKNGGLFVTWEDDRGGDGNETVYLARVDPDGKFAEVVVPGDSGSANYPDVATIDGRAAVVYYQFRDGPPAVYLSLMSPDLQRSCEELRVSGRQPSKFARVAAGQGALGVAYALRNGPAHLAVVTCSH